MTISSGGQVAWVGDNVQGHSMDTNGEIDPTEGFGAIDSVFKVEALGPRVIDVGGGAYDTNRAYFGTRYLVDCEVYDPYKRSPSHNQRVITASPFSAALSFSVLNVISTEDARLAHILLCRSVLKTGGKALFKAWPGDQSGEGKETKSGYQSNRGIETYMEELQSVFGTSAVFFHSREKVVRCTNPLVSYPSGSVSI